MKEYYSSPKLEITCFAPREYLSADKISMSFHNMVAVTYSAASETEPEPGDIFFPITPIQ